MPYLPSMTAIAETPIFTQTFGGYNRHDVIQEGEMYDELNISGKDYPALSTRKLRGTCVAYYDNSGEEEEPVYEYDDPQGLLAKAALVTIDGPNVYLAGHIVDGIELSTAENMLPKQIVSMGAYVCIFPDAVYFNSVYLLDCGYMAAEWNQTTQGVSKSLTAAMCTADGTALAASEYSIGATAPGTPENGDLWVDTSSVPHLLKTWNATTAEWVGMASTYVRIESTGIGQAFAKDDAVFISGIECPDQYAGLEIENQVAALNECMTIYSRGDDYLIVAGILDTAITMETGSVKVERKVPKLDFVVEAENRIWGCTYGLVDGTTLNEIHCCALGDFKNWYQYAGLSTDSYTASCGTDGPFTGAGVLKGSPVFFKEHCLHRVSGSMPSTYQVITTMCRGVQAGSWRSVQVVGESLIYKGRTDVMSYDGSLPVPISEKLGGIRYYDAVAGAFGDLYYISMRDEQNAWHLFTFDSGKGIWHKQDALHALCMAALHDELYCIDADSKKLIAMNGTDGNQEDRDDLNWRITFGAYGFDAERQKYLSKFVLRMMLTKGSVMHCYMQYDSSGEWEHIGTAGFYTDEKGSFTLPIIPKRCDHCQLKLEGHGEMKLYSIARTYRGGSRNGRGIS